MKVIIIGAVSAGTKTAEMFKRENPDAEVIIYTKSKDISYADCGLPYYVGSSIEAEDELLVNTPQKFTDLTGVTVHTESEVTAINPENKTITVCGEQVSYDSLVIAVDDCAMVKNRITGKDQWLATSTANTTGRAFNITKKSLSEGEKLPADEIKRVKGLGCLQDKRFPDVFNVRVITRNGKITVAEHHAVAEAAERFGSGEIAMTSRLTMEIQGVKYENIDSLIAFLAEFGLETGGTGPLVRPVVSCKGTTCQYGLIDTFGLSEKIHERFYKGYHSVTLPHKFKIAVGGCPNNCVKPDLNDLGIIGQSVPMFDFSKCRGCKVCQVENTCPIKIATMQDNKLVADSEACNGCGRCKGKCPFGVTEKYISGWKITIGGRWGKKVAMGKPLSKIFTSEDEVLDAVERAILIFRNEGITGERFADTINRLGFEYVEDKILNAPINKDEILVNK